MGKVIKANLSVKSITDAIEQIRKYQEELDSKVKEFTKRLAEEGVQIAKANVVDLDAVFTGELLGHSFASGAMNRPSFADSQEGDSVRVRLTNKYVNGELTDRYISEIR